MEDGGGDDDDDGVDESRSAFTGQGKGAEPSAGAVGTGASVRGAEGPRDDLQGKVSNRVAPNEDKQPVFVKS